VALSLQLAPAWINGFLIQSFPFASRLVWHWPASARRVAIERPGAARKVLSGVTLLVSG